ncbi:MAG: hypothetical protein EPO65_00585 [Dehalococcoidia bacterium]|nr:MAG: hypothetical protein EPO65_00585 [Dehalococcoidia bacterium]
MPSAGEVIEAWHGGRIATTTATSNSTTFTTTETVTDSVTAALVNGERYLVEFWAGFASSVANDQVQVNLREDNLTGTLLAFDVGVMPIASVIKAFYVRREYTATATGNKTFVATGDRYAGTGNVYRGAASTVPALLTVTHIKEA